MGQNPMGFLLYNSFTFLNINIVMHYYLPSSLVTSDMYVGNSLDTLNACFTSLDTSLYNLSVFTFNETSYLSSSIISLSSAFTTRINYLSSAIISVSSFLQAEIDNFQITNFTYPNDTIPVLGFTFKNTPYSNFDITLSAGGTGATLAQVPDNTTTGGNKRGKYATDWQKYRNSQTQIASGDFSVINGGGANTAAGSYSVVGGGFNNNVLGSYSTIMGGRNNAVSGNYSTIAGGLSNISIGDYSLVTGGLGNSVLSAYAVVAGGINNVASGAYAVVGGGSNNSASASGSCIPGGSYAHTYHTGQFAHANGCFFKAGDSQFSRFILKGITANSTVRLMPSPNIEFTFPDNKVWDMRIKVSGIRADGGGVISFQTKYTVKSLSGVITDTCGVGNGPYPFSFSNSVNLSAYYLPTISSNIVAVSATSPADAFNWYWTAVIDTVDIGIPV
jgi:hypothetical protein